jgi:hypothetical protein
MTALQASQLMDPQTRPADPAASKRPLLSSCLVTRSHATHICANACHALGLTVVTLREKKTI